MPVLARRFGADEAERTDRVAAALRRVQLEPVGESPLPEPLATLRTATPVRVRVRWRGVLGDSELVLGTTLNNERKEEEEP